MTRADDRIAAAVASGDIRAAEYWRAVKATADAAPPLTSEQVTLLRVLFGGRPRGAAKAA